MLLSFALLIYGCAGGQGGQQGGLSNLTGGQVKQCPSSCNDNNLCTTDYCNASTSFECKHIPIKNCYVNSVLNFSTIYPDAWQAKEELAGTKVSFIAPQEDNLTVADCVILTTQVPAMNTSELSIFYYGVKYVFIKVYNCTITYEDNRTVGGEHAYEFFSTCNTGRAYKGQTLIVKSQSLIVIKNGTSYSFDCATPQTIFDKYESNFETIITNFKFTD